MSKKKKKKIYMSKKFEVEKNSKSDNLPTSYQPSTIANPTEQPTKERKKKVPIKIGTNQRTKA